MSSLKGFLTLLLAVAWVPLTAHCRIERLTGLQVLRCAAVETEAPATNSHCDPNACCVWESGQYRLPQGQPVVEAPLLASVPLPVVTVKNWTAADPGCVLAAEFPPGSPKPWQFCLRAALPVRAPSFAS